jgi:hypothetical protein
MAKDTALLQAGVQSLLDENKRLGESLLYHQDVGRLPDILQKVVTYEEPIRRWVIPEHALAALSPKELKILKQVLPK